MNPSQRFLHSKLKVIAIIHYFFIQAISETPPLLRGGPRSRLLCLGKGFWEKGCWLFACPVFYWNDCVIKHICTGPLKQATLVSFLRSGAKISLCSDITPNNIVTYLPDILALQSWPLLPWCLWDSEIHKIHPEIKFEVPRLLAVLINHERHSQRSLKAAILMVMVCYSEKTQIKTREGTQNIGATNEPPVSLS